MLAAVGASQCNVGNPEVRAGRNDLIFGTTSCDPASNTCVDTPRIDRYIASPFYHYDFRSWALQGNSDGLPGFDLTSFSLANTPYVQYAADTAFWTTLSGGGSTPGTQDYWNQNEVLLFARDPVEMTNHFRDIVTTQFISDGVDPSITNPQDSGTVKDELAKILGPGTPDAPGIWRFQWHNCQVPQGSTFGCGGAGDTPNAATLLYPPQRDWTTTDLSVPQFSVPVVANVTPLSFWPGGVTPSGPGSLPHPQDVGSIKAAKVINHGICASFSAYCSGPPDATGAPTCCEGGPDAEGRLLCPDGHTVGTGLFEQLAANIPLTLAKGLDSGNNLERRWLDVAPFLNFTEEQEDAQLGGFFLGFNFQANVIAGGGPNIFYYDAHTWKLFDGRLTAGGEILYSFGDGAAADCLRYSSDSLLTREIDSPTLASTDVVRLTGASPSTLAQAIFQGANKKQVYVGKFNIADQCDGQADLGVAGTPQNPPPKDDCGDFFNSLQNDLDDALSILSGPLGITTSQAAQIKATMNATNSAGILKNLRCAQFPGDEAASCQYVMRAKRLNVYPDGIELVFIDDPHDFSNPSYPIWLILLANKLENPNAAIDLYGALCGQPHAQTPGTLGSRSFNMDAVDFARYSCNAATSAPGDGCPYLTSTGHTASTCTDITITTTP